ncbi:hypothetical protein KR059_010683 [Drosophila kikkawai]|nr:hypothetical protein KR059_010683 [Drosophila kikkawai]
MFVEYLKKNLAIVNADTAQKAAELERLQKVKKQLLDYNYGCVSTASEDPYPEKENLLPSLNQVNSKAEELVGQLGELLGAKCNVHQAYDEHCQEVKSVTAEQLKTRYDQYSTMNDADLGKAIDEAKESMQETLDKTAAKKSELANKKKEHQAKHSAMMKEIETLNHVEQDAIEHLEHLRLKEALGN